MTIMNKVRESFYTKWAIAVLMALSFLSPSVTLMIHKAMSQTVVWEVCTDHGVQLVEINHSKSEDPSKIKLLDHCPLCQVQNHLPPLQGLYAFEGIVFKARLISVEHAQVLQTAKAWLRLPSRAPPIFA